MSTKVTQQITFTTGLECRYLVHEPERVSAATRLVVALHGFGSNPEIMLKLTAGIVSPNDVIASLQGPHAFYLPTTPRQVGYCWATDKHAEASVALHHRMLLHVLNEAGARYGIPAMRRFVVGFSQPVGLNYRFAATYPHEIRGAIGICGGIPKDWEEGRYMEVSAALLHIARTEDEYYPPETTRQYAGRLRLRASDVEFAMLEGPHRFPSKARPLIDGWLARLTDTAPQTLTA